MVKIIDGEAFKNMLVMAAGAVEEKKQEINELNVFPVPDGDTGTNMSLTLNAAATELMKFEKPTLGKAVDTTSAGDCFTAAFALRLVEGETSLQAALEFANTAAALTASRPGAQASIPARDEVEALLAAR